MTESLVLRNGPQLGRLACTCLSKSSGIQKDDKPQLVAITGGPGAGKTAILNIAQNMFCKHVAFLPESATILFTGGFWRHNSANGRKAAQRSIFQIQRELEDLYIAERLGAFGLCDRGTVDGAAYWPEEFGDYWTAMGTTREIELRRYRAVIHLRSPGSENGYDLSNPARIESAELSEHIDIRIFDAWKGHPNRTVIEANASFKTKIDVTIEALREIMVNKC